MPHSLTHRRLKRTYSIVATVVLEHGADSGGGRGRGRSKEWGKAFTHLQEILPYSSNIIEAIEGTSATAQWHTRCSGRRRACSRSGGGRSATRLSSGNSSGMYALQQAFLAFLCQFSFEAEHFFRQMLTQFQLDCTSFAQESPAQRRV